MPAILMRPLPRLPPTSFPLTSLCPRRAAIAVDLCTAPRAWTSHQFLHHTPVALFASLAHIPSSQSLRRRTHLGRRLDLFLSHRQSFIPTLRFPNPRIDPGCSSRYCAVPQIFAVSILCFARFHLGRCRPGVVLASAFSAPPIRFCLNTTFAQASPCSRLNLTLIFVGASVAYTIDVTRVTFPPLRAEPPPLVPYPTFFDPFTTISLSITLFVSITTIILLDADSL